MTSLNHRIDELSRVFANSHPRFMGRALSFVPISATTSSEYSFDSETPDAAGRYHVRRDGASIGFITRHKLEGFTDECFISKAFIYVDPTKPDEPVNVNTGVVFQENSLRGFATFLHHERSSARKVAMCEKYSETLAMEIALVDIFCADKLPTNEEAKLHFDKNAPKESEKALSAVMAERAVQERFTALAKEVRKLYFELSGEEIPMFSPIIKGHCHSIEYDLEDFLTNPFFINPDGNNYNKHVDKPAKKEWDWDDEDEDNPTPTKEWMCKYIAAQYGRYGYVEHETMLIPFRWLDDGSWREEMAEAIRLQKEAAQKEKGEREKKSLENKRKQYEKLKAELGE